jgi:hypothetical protein
MVLPAHLTVYPGGRAHVSQGCEYHPALTCFLKYSRWALAWELFPGCLSGVLKGRDPFLHQGGQLPWRPQGSTYCCRAEKRLWWAGFCNGEGVRGLHSLPATPRSAGGCRALPAWAVPWVSAWANQVQTWRQIPQG